ncbi:MAG: hypothetical protein ABW195_10350 [Ilumatobacteraceae bacterium]
MSDDGSPPPERARTLVVRVWLPDRPGALGQVASRIGAVHGDVTAIDILERGGGRVVDELVVSLPESAAIDLLAKEIGAVDGVAVEQIRTVGDERPDSATAVLQLAAAVAETAPAERLGALVSGLLHAADADWAVAVRGHDLVHRLGEPPELAWLIAFIEGSGHLDPACPSSSAPTDVMWARLPSAGLVVAAGRAQRAVHERERARIAVLARIVDQMLVA